MLGRSIASVLDQDAIFTKAQSAEVNMVLRSYISAIDLPTILHIIHIGHPCNTSFPMVAQSLDYNYYAIVILCWQGHHLTTRS